MILVVDDEQKNIQVVGSMLVKHGHEVIAATGGKDAFLKLETVRPDVILLDVMMPGMTGFEVCRKLRTMPELRDIPVIFLSAAADKSFIVEALEAGGVDYITKPFHGRELLSRVELHANLRKTRERLAEVLRQKNRLLEIVAHDLKNPLSGTRFTLALLQEKRELSESQREKLLNHLTESNDRAFEIVNSLLETHEVEQAKQQASSRPLSLNATVAKALRSFDQHVDAKRISVIEKLDEDQVVVEADERALLCCLENLISNAFKFSPVQSSIMVGTLRHKSRGVFWVEDQGPGVEASEVPLLFQKFTRLSAKPTAGESSTGMGLHIAHELITAMNGDLTYERGRSVGSRFIVTLPLAG